MLDKYDVTCVTAGLKIPIMNVSPVKYSQKIIRPERQLKSFV